MLVRADRTDLTMLEDFQGKRIAATDPNDLFSYQAQVNMLRRRDLNIQEMARQIVYTHSRSEVMRLVVEGKVDIGFLKAGYLEDAIEQEVVAPNVLRSLEPITTHIVSGSKLFPFEVSTLLFPDSPIVMHSSVNYNVQALVTSALLDINSTSAMAAYGRYAGWRPAANYLEVLNAMETAGLFDPETERCKRSVKLGDSIVCPAQKRPQPEAKLLSSCKRAGIACPKPQLGVIFDCVCTACEMTCGENQIETSPGTCECDSGYIDVSGECMPTAAFALIIVVPVLVGLFFLIRYLLKWQQRRSDQIWYIKPHELEFDDPAVCLGSGTFGVVIQAEYRGSAVALKSILERGQKLDSALGSISVKGKRGYGGLLGRQTGTGTAKSGKSHGKQRGLIASGFDHVEDDHARGLAKLKRALAQANAAVQAKRRDKSSKNVNDGEAQGPRSMVGSAVAGSRANRSKSRSRSLSTLFKSRARVEREQFIVEMRLLSKLRHPCVATVIGAVLEPNCPPILVMEHMDLGSLHSLLHNPSMEVDPAAGSQAYTIQERNSGVYEAHRVCKRSCMAYGKDPEHHRRQVSLGSLVSDERTDVCVPGSVTDWPPGALTSHLWPRRLMPSALPLRRWR